MYGTKCIHSEVLYSHFVTIVTPVSTISTRINNEIFTTNVTLTIDEGRVRTFTCSLANETLNSPVVSYWSDGDCHINVYRKIKELCKH